MFNFQTMIQNQMRRHWLIAGAAITLLAAGVYFGPYRSVANAGEDGGNSQSEPTTTNQLEANPIQQLRGILEDESKEPEARINDALALLDEVEANQHHHLMAFDPFASDPFSADPFANDWPSFSPFTGNSQNWDPFTEINRIRERMDRMFNESMGRMQMSTSGTLGAGGMSWSPQGEFETTDEAYIYRIDVPGVEKGEINITLDNGTLSIEGKREAQTQQSDSANNNVRREIRYGAFQRTFTVPADVDTTKTIESNLEDGVLTITLPRDTGTDLPKSIKVN